MPQVRLALGRDLQRPAVRRADHEVSARAALVLEELEGIGAAVADLDPMAARGGRADLPGRLDPQQALAAGARAAGGHALPGGDAGAVVQLLTDQAEQLTGLRIDGERVVALVAA